MKTLVRFTPVVVLLGLVACAPKASTIPGTTIPDSTINRDIIQVIEDYRMAVERQDEAALLLMASPNYWEDGGTPSGADDYGFEGLREVLRTRFHKVDDVRYSLKYLSVERRCRDAATPDSNQGCRAYVDVMMDASFNITDARGRVIRPDKRDRNQIVLEWSDEKEKWLFLSGM